MSDIPSISVIMAAYNAGTTIEQALHSVMEQSYKNTEIIVVDDCSTDNTVEIVNQLAGSDKRIKLIKNDRNRGVSYTRKRALDSCTGDWIAILDSDDYWDKCKLDKQLMIHDKTNAQLIYTGSGFIDSNGAGLDWILHVPTTMTYKQLLKQNLISNSSALVKRDLYEEFYSSGDDMHEDFATWLRILKSGVTAYGIDEPLLIYRLSSNSKSSNKLKSAKMNWNTYRYVGLNAFASLYYMVFYMFKGIMKYRNLKN